MTALWELRVSQGYQVQKKELIFPEDTEDDLSGIRTKVKEMMRVE